jgi:hypothetical protein
MVAQARRCGRGWERISGDRGRTAIRWQQEPREVVRLRIHLYLRASDISSRRAANQLHEGEQDYRSDQRVEYRHEVRGALMIDAPPPNR